VKNRIVQFILAALLNPLVWGAKPVVQTIAPRKSLSAQSASPLELSPPVPPADSGKKTGVLNFEADIVEGEKQRPELFYQMETKNLSFDTLFYIRTDLNDSFDVEKSRRPRSWKEP